MSILDRSSSECEAKRQKLKTLLETLEEIQTLRENQNVEEEINKILEIIKESSQIVQNSDYPGEMIIDAKILHSGTVFCNANIALLNTTLILYDEEKYINGICNLVENSCETIPASTGWQKLASLTYHLFKKSEPLTFMCQSITFEPVSTQEKKKIIRQKKTAQPEKKVLESMAICAKEEEEHNFCEHLFMWLVKHYKCNERKPVNYFTFIIDPSSFWTTIENIFYFAFLVRDGNVKMLIKNGLPYVKPLLRNAENQSFTNFTNSQFCFDLNMSSWKEIIKKFHITSSSFPPFAKNKSSKRHKIKK